MAAYKEADRILTISSNQTTPMKKLILITLALLIFQKWDAIQNLINPQDYSALQKGDVVLYATAWCGYCKKTRELLAEHNIPYLEYDIEQSGEGKAQYDSLGGGGVPLLLIKGELVKGFNSDRILSLVR